MTRRARATRRRSRDTGSLIVDPITSELLDLDRAASSGLVAERLQALRKAFAGETDPIRIETIKAELVRRLKQHNITGAARLAEAVFERPPSAEHQLEDTVDHTLPLINSADLNLPKIAEQAWAALQAANKTRPVLFRVGATISRLESGALQLCTQDRLRYQLARVATWYHKKSTRSSLPPLHVVRDMLARPDPPVPELERIVGAPVFAPDGTLLMTPGYHPAGRVYYEPSGLEVAAISAAPSDDELQAAVRTLEEPLTDFPFGGDPERAHALAFLLLPFARAMIDGPTPLHLFEKPAPRTGASLLVSVLTLPVLGRPVAMMTAARDSEEWRKRLLAKLSGTPSIVVIDNVRARLDSEHLASVLTAWPSWEDRPMGQSEMRELPVRCIWAATGNNPALSNELAGRVVRIRLDAKTDTPWEGRSYRIPKLLEWVTRHRGELVHAALTLWRAWLARGRPPAPTTATLKGFEAWSFAMGGVLATAKIPGFLGNVQEVYALSDFEGAETRRLVRLWWDRFDERPVGTQELYPLAEEADLSLKGASERGRRTSLGARLASLRDRRFVLETDGESVALVLGSAGRDHSAAQWRLFRAPSSEKGSPGSPGSPASAQAFLGLPENKDGQSPRLGEPREPGEPGEPVPALPRVFGDWTCPACQVLNAGGSPCELCSAPAPVRDSPRREEGSA